MAGSIAKRKGKFFLSSRYEKIATLIALPSTHRVRSGWADDLLSVMLEAREPKGPFTCLAGESPPGYRKTFDKRLP